MPLLMLILFFGTEQNAQNTSNTGGGNVFDELTNIANNN